MKRKSLSPTKDNRVIDKFAKKIKTGRYFRKISLSLIKEMLIQGEYVNLNAEEFLIQESNSKPPELIVLLEGSLAVTSKDHFIMRLNQPGDVVGEMSVIYSNSKPFADVISEESSQVIIFPNHLFKVAEDDTKVSIAYFLFSHILAEKLKHATAHSLLNKNFRSQENTKPIVIILDSDKYFQKKIKSALKLSWENTHIIELESFSDILKNPLDTKIDFLIVDPEKIPTSTSKKDSIRNLIEIFSLQQTPILAISKYCKKEDNRKFLASLGVSDFLKKPFTDFDLQHKLTNFRKDHFRKRELEQVEIAADTDRLTGLANRRKMDEFLDALVTIFPEEKQHFSIIIADVDHFKQYNDTHGHQLGDIVLISVASILKNRIRRGDLAARFGGEEFVIILPNCTKKNAINIAEKLRMAIANEKLPFQEQQPLGNLTCTFGVATFPEDADTKELLLKKADESLYFGKSSGRNKLVSAKPS